uniref:Uncharacterized protein n=1 Tax=Anguilla anguilla TaxID=7936 RepID=A0A0E9TM84_ANGAN
MEMGDTLLCAGVPWLVCFAKHC